MPSLARFGALVAAGTLVTTGLVSGMTTPAVAAANDPRPVTIGASWLEDQLTNGLIHNDQYDFDDLGLTLDVGFALDAVGGYASTVSAISSAMAAHIGDYIAYPGHTIAGSIAKAGAFAIAAGDDPTSYGGENLVTDLESRVAGSDPVKGRIEDAYTPGPFESDFANVLGQAYAVRVLAHAASAEAADATAYLLEQQCSDGYFRLNFPDPAATDQSCDAGVASGESPADTDATAIATLMLDQSGIDTKAVGRAVARAESWLLAAQRPDGSFGGGTSTEGANANSTGLAGAILGGLGHPAAAAKAAAWVRAHQADEVADCPSALSGATGAIAYDDAGLKAGRSGGIPVTAADQWRRATSQALPVLAYAAPSAGSLSVKGPAGFVAAGSTASYDISGLAPGQTACVRGIGAAHPVAAGADGGVVDRLALPAGTATRTVTVTDRGGDSAAASTAVLGAALLKVAPSKSKVHRGAKVRIVVQGLVPGERVTLLLRGVTVRVGLADAGGRFVRVIGVGRKVGKARIVARGQFPVLRHGDAVIRVVR